jgi:hypothetical protein
MENTISLRFLLIIFIFLFGCNRPSEKSIQRIVNDTLKVSTKGKDFFYKKPTLTNEIELDSIPKINFINPNFYFGDGGGGVFTYDTTEIVNNKLIFISSLGGDSALIKINHKELFLIPDLYNNIPRKGNLIQDAWKGNGLSIILKLTLSDKGQEIKAKGIMEIKNDKHTARIKVHGIYEE